MLGAASLIKMTWRQGAELTDVQRCQVGLIFPDNLPKGEIELDVFHKIRKVGKTPPVMKLAPLLTSGNSILLRGLNKSQATDNLSAY